MVGIPTVLITVEPAESGQARPPRALCPRGFTVGHTFGRPKDTALHRWIIMDALGLLSATPTPGEVTIRDYG